MFKLIKVALVGALIVGAFRLGAAVQDQQTLTEEIIRLHVVANSNSEEDQALKLQVRDAVLDCLADALEEVQTKLDAKAYIEEHLEQIVETANRVIREAGFDDRVTVTLTEEEFDTREYETFTLPAGVYDSLRIVIGDGEGQNWWCVVFPKFCTQAASVKDTAAGAGFSDTLTDSICNEDGYEIRFFVLDCIGRIQNFFHRG